MMQNWKHELEELLYHLGIYLSQDGYPVICAAADLVLQEPERLRRLMTGVYLEVAKRCDAGVIVRGVRGESDLGYEMPLAEANRHLAGLDTLFFVARPELAYLSSTIVMDIARHGGDVSEMIPAQVADDIVNAIKEC